MNNSLNNRRIAKNTILLYIRMLLSIVVSLYTSRVVLQTLGVDDFGTYGVVGGIVSMFAFLNASMSGATSRFITFALGKGEKDDVKETFSTALIIHVGIALIIVFLAETIGLWFLENKLVIPEDRMFASRIVYQFSVLSMAVQVTQVPYNASIISYEKMDVYAYVELLNVVLKLAIVYLLLIGDFDKLILYSILVFIVNVIVAFSYRIYCLQHFATCRFNWVLKKEKLFPMLSFSGWDLYGNMCYSVRQQGVNMLINMFFGVALNAASSVASSIQAIIASLSANVIQAFRPQIVKTYSQNNILDMQMLMSSALKYTLLLFLLIAIPVSLEMENVMHIWLGQVPDYASSFCRIMLGVSMLNLVNNILCIAIESTGKMKRVSFISGTIYLLTIPTIYILFKYVTDNVLFSYVVSLVIVLLVVVVDFTIVKKQIPGININSIAFSCAFALFIAVISSIPALLLFYIININPYIEILVISSVYALSLTFFTILLDRQLRMIVISKINRKKTSK